MGILESNVTLAEGETYNLTLFLNATSETSIPVNVTFMDGTAISKWYI